MENMQQINNDIEQTEKAINDNKVSLQAELDSAKQQIELLTKEIADRDSAIKKYQELNQSLFLRVAAPMQQQHEEEPKDPDLVSALEKIRIHNEGVMKNGSNNK